MPVAVNCCVAPGPIEAVAGETPIDTKVGAPGATVTVVAVEPVSSAAVTVTTWLVVTEPAVPVNAAAVAFAGTVTELGTASALGLSDDTATTVPFAPAGCVNVTVHVVVPPDTTLDGLHATPPPPPVSPPPPPPPPSTPPPPPHQTPP